jgi:Domain of unknown function DUF29
MDDRTLYETDIVAWAEQQAAALRVISSSPAGRSNAVDWQNVVEEIESLGRSQIRAVESKLTLIFVRLLKIVSDPGRFRRCGMARRDHKLPARGSKGIHARNEKAAES